MKKKLFLLIAFCFLTVSCTYDKAEPPTVEVPRLISWGETESDKEFKRKKAEELSARQAKEGRPLSYQDALLLSKQTPSTTSVPLHRIWQVKPGLLRAQLENWASSAGYQVVWKVSHDYHLQSSAQFQGDIVHALNSLFTGLQQRGNTFQVTVYHGNKVILVSEE